MSNIISIDEQYLENEIFIKLNWNNILIQRYAISNYGRLYDLYKKTFVAYSVDKDGYFMASIKIEENDIGYKKIRVHRFELMSFYPISNFEEMQVNHRDGNKQNLLLSNLEWKTPMGNTRHGWKNDLNNNVGINNGNGKLTDEMIHSICNLIDQGYSGYDICDKLGVVNVVERKRILSHINSIKNGKTHKYISAGYRFMNNQLPVQFGENLIYLICNFLSDKTRDYTYKEIMDHLQISNNHRLQFKIFINDIINGRTGKNISKLYGDLKRPKDFNDRNDYLMS